MPTNSLSLSLCDSLYISQIAALLIPSWKTRNSKTVTGKPSVIKVDSGIKVEFGDSGKVEVNRTEIVEIKSQVANSYKTWRKINTQGHFYLTGARYSKILLGLISKPFQYLFELIIYC